MRGETGARPQRVDVGNGEALRLQPEAAFWLLWRRVPVCLKIWRWSAVNCCTRISALSGKELHIKTWQQAVFACNFLAGRKHSRKQRASSWRIANIQRLNNKPRGLEKVRLLAHSGLSVLAERHMKQMRQVSCHVSQPSRVQSIQGHPTFGMLLCRMLMASGLMPGKLRLA